MWTGSSPICCLGASSRAYGAALLTFTCSSDIETSSVVLGHATPLWHSGSSATALLLDRVRFRRASPASISLLATVRTRQNLGRLLPTGAPTCPPAASTRQRPASRVPAPPRGPA